MKLKTLFVSFFVIASVFNVQADQTKNAPIPPLRGPDGKPSPSPNQIKDLPPNVFQGLTKLQTLSSSGQQKLEEGDSLLQKAPLLGYLRVKNFEKIKQELGDKTYLAFQRLVKISVPTKITEPASIFAWGKELTPPFQIAAVLPVDLDDKNFLGWLKTFRKSGFPQTQAMQYSEHSPLSLVTTNNITRDLVQQTGNSIEMISRSPMDSDVEMYVNLRSRFPDVGGQGPSLFPPLVSMLLSQTGNPMRAVASSDDNAPQSLFLQVKLSPEQVNVSQLMKRRENEVKTTDLSKLPSIVHFLPEGALRFEWRTEDPEMPLFQMLPRISDYEHPVLVRPIVHILSEIRKHSKTVVIAGSIEAPKNSAFGPNRLLAIALENEKAAKAFLEALQQEALWTNDGRLHATLEDKYGMNLHISIRPSCRKIEAFPVDCYYARITEKIPNKKRKYRIDRPYTYQAVRIGTHVLLSWNEEKPETTKRLDSLVKTFISGNVEYPLGSIQNLPKGADLYVDTDLTLMSPRFQRILPENTSKQLEAIYMDGKFFRREVQISRSVLVAMGLLK